MSIETYGRFQLIKRVATGGMAQIYLARQTGPEGFEKLMVVKRILPHLAENADFVRMFLDEARIAARLNHPNIVQIFDLGAEQGTYFIAMEYIHGEDVRRVWKRGANHGTPMPIPLVCRVVMEACSGLHYAHKKTDGAGKPLGIVHRDVSPQNILVTFEGGVKLVDFGIAKAADQATVTRSGVLKGKYSYMSPEQANGKKLDNRSDIFAMGVVLHELLTGNRLFKRANDILTLNAVTECQVPAPSSLNPAIPKDLDRIVLKALAKEPEQRFQDAVELQVALEEWLIAHQLPSSSAHLGSYMQQLYAERLAQEKAAGQVLVEEASDVPRSTAEEDFGPARGGRPPPPPQEISLSGASRRTELGLPNLADMEATYAERPAERLIDRPLDRPGDRPIDRVSSKSPFVASGPGRPRTGESKATPAAHVPAGPRFDTNRFAAMEPGEESLANTQTTEAESAPRGLSGTVSFTLTRPKRRRWLPVSISLVSLLVLAGVGYRLWERQAVAASAAVRLTTEPAGATVFLDGQPVIGLKTPCVLPEVSAGTHTLLVGAAGYLDHRSELTVPAGGVLEVPTIRLAPEPPVPAADPPAAPEPVTFRIRTEPVGATVLVDGKPLGQSPQELHGLPGAQLALKVELAGYQAAARTVTVTAGGEELVTLEKAPAAKTPERPRDRPREPERVAKGKVRFVVSPWASVSCGSLELGTTPFADRELPAGVYQCRFTNPEHGTQTRKVEVRPNMLEKVLVQF